MLIFKYLYDSQYSNNAEYEVIADSEDQLTEVASVSVTNTVNAKKPAKMLNEARNRVVN